MFDEVDNLMSFFRGAVGSDGGKKQYTPADELDDMWREYNDYINELKADGYKVLRNENGKHKIIQN